MLARATAAMGILSLSLVACGGGGGTPSPLPMPTQTSGTNTIDGVVERAYPRNIGVELAIYKHGAVFYQHGYGLRDRGLPDVFAPTGNFWRVPQADQLLNPPRGASSPDAQTVFELASVSKEFTAGAILLLQQDGKLSVSDPVAKYFPSLPDGSAITLQDLLWHTSGFVEYTTFGQYPDFKSAYSQFLASNSANYQPIVQILATFPLNFAPGTAYNYNNTDYVLLSMIVAKVTHESFATFLQQRIFGPLGMTHSHQGIPPAPETDFALGYQSVGSSWDRSWQYNLAYLAGPGGLTSTVDDLEKWDQAVRKPGIFTQASLTEMFSANAFPLSYGTYADGWFVATLNGHRYIWHDGFIEGYQTFNGMFPDDGIDVIVLTNASEGGTDPYYIVPQLFPLMFVDAGSAREQTVDTVPPRS